MTEDSLHSTFIIWVKNEVPSHYHATHTEVVNVVSGSGNMTLGDRVFQIHPGDLIVIPMGETHAVVTTSEEPLKVVSIQTPRFDGDRVWVK